MIDLSEPAPEVPRLVQVTSAKNPIIKQVREAAVGKLPGLMVAEGKQLVRDALEADVPFRLAAASPKLLEARDGHALRRQLEQRSGTFLDVNEHVLEKMSTLQTPQGVLAVLERPLRQLDGIAPDVEAPMVVVAAGLRDPGNLGAVVRTAEAAGADGLVVLRGSADPFREKAVRGSMGSVFRLPIASGGGEDGSGPVGVEPRELAAWIERRKIRLVVLDSEGGGVELGDEVSLRGAVGIVLGGEGSGIEESLRDAAESRIRVPMQAPVESLNVAVAAGVVLYEARRQRKA